MSTEIRRFPLERFSIPSPKDRTSPAKVRNKELDWIHYAHTEKDPLMLEIRTRATSSPAVYAGRASGAVYAGYSHHGVVGGRDGTGDQCIVRVICGNVCYKELSIDEYRNAYESQSRSLDRPTDYEDEAEWQNERMPIVDTIKLTVKPPGVAFKLLTPLEQLSGRRSVYKSAGDYTYDRFQLRFSSDTDIDAFLAIIYTHFPSLDPSFRAYSAQPEPPAESLAVSQNTQIYLPDDPAWRINRRSDAVSGWNSGSPVKRRKLNDENVYHRRTESESVSEMVRGQTGYTERRDPLQGYPKNRHGSPMRHQLKQTSHQHGPPRRYSPLSQRYEREPPSIDQDGFVKPLLPLYKPLPPAYIDTPTPANRIYHLKEVDPNQTSRQSYSTPPTLSSKRPRDIADPDDPFVGRSKFDMSPRNTSSPASHRIIQASFKLPPLRHDLSPRLVEEESLKTLPTGLTQLEPQGRGNNKESEAPAWTERDATSQTDVSSRSLRYILAPETVAASNDDRRGSPAVKNLLGPHHAQQTWPEMYGNPLSTCSRPLDSVVKETSDTQQSTAERKDHMSKVTSSAPCNDTVREANAPQEEVTKPADHRTSEPEQASLPNVGTPIAKAHQAGMAPGEIPRPSFPMPSSAASVTAHIARASSLYALSPDELSHSINSILLEDGFVPFVERLGEQYRELLTVSTTANEEEQLATQSR